MRILIGFFTVVRMKTPQAYLRRVRGVILEIHINDILSIYRTIMAATGNKPFSTDEVTLDSYFRENNLIVPNFQREYEWTIKEEIPTLWSDLFDNLIKNDQSYFLATPVIYPYDDEQMGIVDGQQRTITLALMIAAFRDCLRSIGGEEAVVVASEISQLIYDRISKSVRLNTEQSKDAEILEEVLNFKFNYTEEYGSNNNDHRISKSYRYFYDELQKKIDGKTDEEKILYLDKLQTKILTNTYFGLTIATDSNTAILIFMTMNNRGKDLEQSDLVKAELFAAGTRHGKATAKTVVNRWNNLKGDHNSKFLSNLLHDYITVRNGKTPSGGSYRSYNQLLKGFKTKAKFVEFLKEVNRFKGFFIQLGDKDGGLTFTDLVRCKVRYATCLMVQAKVDAATEDQIDQIEKMLDAIYAHHFVGEKDSNILKRRIISWANHLYKHNDLPSLLAKMKSDIKSENLLSSRDAFIENIVKSKSFENKHNEAQFFLRRIERYYLPEGTKITGPKAVNIEHVAPQDPSEGTWEHIEKPWIHKLGNLTLCDSTKNKKLGNKIWSKKVAMWEKSVKPYATTHGELTISSTGEKSGPSLDLNLAEWTHDEIEERSKRLAEFCFDVIFKVDLD